MGPYQHAPVFDAGTGGGSDNGCAERPGRRIAGVFTTGVLTALRELVKSGRAGGSAPWGAGALVALLTVVGAGGGPPPGCAVDARLLPVPSPGGKLGVEVAGRNLPQQVRASREALPDSLELPHLGPEDGQLRRQGGPVRSADPGSPPVSGQCPAWIKLALVHPGSVAGEVILQLLGRPTPGRSAAEPPHLAGLLLDFGGEVAKVAHKPAMQEVVGPCGQRYEEQEEQRCRPKVRQLLVHRLRPGQQRSLR